MIQNGKPDDVSVDSLKGVLVGGGPMSKEQVDLIRKYIPNAKIAQGYGLTEISGAALMFNMGNEEHQELYTKKPGSVGKPISGFSYKV